MHKTVASFKLLLHFTLGSPPVYMTLLLPLTHSLTQYLYFYCSFLWPLATLGNWGQPLACVLYLAAQFVANAFARYHRRNIMILWHYAWGNGDVI